MPYELAELFPLRHEIKRHYEPRLARQSGSIDFHPLLLTSCLRRACIWHGAVCGLVICQMLSHWETCWAEDWCVPFLDQPGVSEPCAIVKKKIGNKKDDYQAGWFVWKHIFFEFGRHLKATRGSFLSFACVAVFSFPTLVFSIWNTNLQQSHYIAIIQQVYVILCPLSFVSLFIRSCSFIPYPQ